MNSKKHTEYLREYRKERIHRIVIFSKEQYQLLLQSAKEHKKPFSTFIRELALLHVSNQYVLPNDEQSKAIQLLLTRFDTNLNQIAHIANATFHISPEGIQDVQNQFQQMKHEITELYNKPLPVEEVVRSAIQKNPKFKKRIETILRDYS